MRGTLLLLLAILMLPVLLVQALIYHTRFDTRRALEYQANLELARAVARSFEGYVRDVLHQQQAIGRALVVRSPAPSPEEAQEILAASADEYASVTLYSWIDANGRLVASSQPVASAVGEHPYVREVVEGRPWVVSDLMQDPVTGDPTFVIARGIRDADGRVQGVIAAAVDPRRLGTALAIPRDEQGAVALIDRRGRGVYRYPEIDLLWEQRDWLATQPIIGPALAGREVTGTFVSVVDGRTRMAGLTPIGPIGWAAGANRPEADALAPVLGGMLAHFGLLVLAALASVLSVVVIGRRLTRSIGRLRDHALAVGRGEFGGSVTIDHPEELRAAAEAFDRMAAEIRTRDEQRRELLATIAHELRNPLTPIRYSVYILERGDLGGEPARRALAVIGRQVDHITRLIDDLLDVHRISTGKLQLQRERVDLNTIVLSTAEDHRDLFERNGIALEVLDAGGQPLAVDADPTRLAQVIGNLLQNSAKFTPRGGRTTVAVEGPHEGHAVVRVRDDGTGITAEGLAQLFQPFAQEEQTLDRSRGGLGLGLAVVKGLVDMHGGTVTAESEGPGKGAQFTVTLPLAAGTPHLPAATAPTRSGAACRVLVIEDNADAAQSLRAALELDGHRVEVASTGPEGIEIARAFQPDVVLCDIGLPGLDGYSVVKAMRADPRTRAAYVVAMSGYALPEDREKARAAGFARHLTKPPSRDALEEILAGVLERRAS
jgi:signal transduction histidine kinase/ActR/RegA family two-component response regulator